MITARMEKEINAQIKAEFESAFIYMGMAAWAHKNGYFGTENFMWKQAKEEEEHAMKFIDYLKDVDATVDIPGIEKPTINYKSILDVFEKGLEHEKYITSRINNLVTISDEEGDYATNDFLQWYVTEQVEEEKTFRDVVKRLRMVGDNINGIFSIDSKLAAR
ncbi:ferroxidase [Mesotoga sp. Brook.08.YT.4.2.5.1]|uniref:Ferritin n=1 Tax=Mesotoga prima TaxID=1184387 RepID=A0A124FXZ0_9BACT|nr:MULTISPECIES: ferritin [unclassified Mesotoga]KUK79525.1 MAG: Ferritin-like protein [Mesotoga prima]PNE20004.1 ferroxidase [Mesotoga sp. Brook.08.YT.4.2.5.1]PNS41163.1 ferroxidase [Mesotoga sp. B105.6.4]PVD17775.1 Ferroxidase [Mesotoga sp. Brook.08.105.5.1]RAO95976.1 Ferroxidase [Mesotoga sp. Brook.08.YT.4.2.5.4.]